jgi:hypothetical protein
VIDSHNYTREFFDLELPKLIRKKIAVGEEMRDDPVNHVVYEVTGTLDQLAKIENSELLDKKMVEKPTEESTLDLKGKSIYEELEIYLNHIKVADVDAVMNEYRSIA